MYFYLGISLFKIYSEFLFEKCELSLELMVSEWSTTFDQCCSSLRLFVLFTFKSLAEI